MSTTTPTKKKSNALTKEERAELRAYMDDSAAAMAIHAERQKEIGLLAKQEPHASLDREARNLLKRAQGLVAQWRWVEAEVLAQDALKLVLDLVTKLDIEGVSKDPEQWAGKGPLYTYGMGKMQKHARYHSEQALFWLHTGQHKNALNDADAFLLWVRRGARSLAR